MSDTDDVTEVQRLRDEVAALREENARLRAELVAARRRDHETPPHYL